MKFPGGTDGLHEVVLEVGFDHTEPFTDALLAAGAMAVTVEDADEGTDAERPIFDEPGENSEKTFWQKSRIIALIPSDTDISQIISVAAAETGLPQTPVFSSREVPANDWVRTTQDQFKPIQISELLWVVPSWHPVPESARIALRVDPGLAFGTGSHATTRQCLIWLEENLFSGASVLDYGCGSGILSMAAFKLGAHPVDGVDIDQQALDTARENASQNQCDISFYEPEQFARYRHGMQYDIIVANILSGTLKKLAESLVSKLKYGGKLALSGILEWQANDVISAYSPWLDLSYYQQDDGWVVLSGTRIENGVIL